MAKHVLVVEDNPQSVELISELIQAEGYRVTTAMSGDEALSKARAEIPDLILMDIQLPGVDGLTVTRALKTDAETMRIPIVGISAHVLKEDVQRALEAGCIAYLPKPLDTRRFLDLVARLLRGDRSGRVPDS
ncbi:MAG: response regulator [Candidatus Methylomirabilaceae bacterium]